jgi:hypothetical protein
MYALYVVHCTACFLLQKRFEEILRQELAWTLAQVGLNKNS